jgi:hypothetical protein
MQILGVGLVLALVASLPVRFLVAGGHVSMPQLPLILVTAVAVADIVTGSLRTIPRRGWPVLNWRRGFA